MRLRTIAICVLLTSASVSAKAEPLKIRMDWTIIPGSFAALMPPVASHYPNVFRHYGKSYVIEPVRLMSGGASLTALAAGELDIAATLGAQTLVLGVTEAKLNIKVIGQALTMELPGHLMTHFWVRKSDIKSLGDLRGKIVAVNARGSNVDAAAHVVMKRAGMEEPRDYQIAEVSFPAMLPALESKRVNAVALVPPFNRIAARNPEFAPLFSLGDAFGPIEALNFMVKDEFLQKNRAVLVDFLEDNIRMRRWMTDRKTRLEAIKVLAETAKAPASGYVDWVYTGEDYYYEPNALVNVERLQNNAQTLKDAGVIPDAFDVKPYVDMSLAKEAAARVKD